MPKIQKVLIAEDNPKLREVYTTFLTEQGYTVETAVDGDDALQKSVEFMPDMVFLDVMMPNKDGFTTLTEMRHNLQYNATKAKIVLLTNLSMASNLSEEAKKDADGYALKAEVVLEDLVEMIKSFEGEETPPEKTQSTSTTKL